MHSISAYATLLSIGGGIGNAHRSLISNIEEMLKTSLDLLADERLLSRACVFHFELGDVNLHTDKEEYSIISDLRSIHPLLAALDDMISLRGFSRVIASTSRGLSVYALRPQCDQGLER